MADNQDDKKVKDLIDEATRAELERWFRLPSFEQLPDQAVKPAPTDKEAERLAIRKRHDDAIAAVDPAMLEAHRRRVEPLAFPFLCGRMVDLEYPQRFGPIRIAI